MEKKIIETNVPEEASIFEVIKEYVEKQDSWVFISENLLKKLSDQYENKKFILADSREFYIPEDDGSIAELMITPMVPKDLSWNKVHVLIYMGKKIYIPANPDKIVFLE